MALLYGQLLDPRDPLFADKDVLPEDKTHLGAPPRNYESFQERFDATVAAEPDAIPERLEQLAIQARKDQRQAVMFFDFTYSADKTTSILHASRCGPVPAPWNISKTRPGTAAPGTTAPCRRTSGVDRWPGIRQSRMRCLAW